MKKIALFVAAFFALILQNASAQTKPASPDFFDNKTVQDIKITFPQKNWNYLLDSLRFNGDGLLECLVEAGGLKFEKAGVRFRGSKSFVPGSLKNPLHIVLNHGNKIQNLNGVHVLKLSNAMRDPSMIREVLGYEIARSYMPAPRANFVRVTINGTYYGLFANIESVEEESFLKRYFGEGGTAFFKANQNVGEKAAAGCKNALYGSLEYDRQMTCLDNNFDKLSEHGTKDLYELTRILAEAPGEIETILHVDATLWMLAFNNAVVNLSSYSGQHSVNYYLYRDAQGRFTPIVWDLNLAFGSFKNTGSGSDLKFKALIELNPLLHLENPAKPLVSKLLENDAYKKTYLSHLRSIVHDYFVSGKYEQRAKELQSLIRTDYLNDPGKTYTMTDFDNSLTQTTGKKSKIPGIVELMTKRTAFLKAHPDLAIFPPDIMEVKVEGREPLSSKPVENFHITSKVDKFPKKVILLYRFGGQGNFSEVSMQDNGKDDDGTANNGVFGVTIVPQNGERSIEYFIKAENAGLFSYSPAAYMWEKHTTSLEALNK